MAAAMAALGTILYWLLCVVGSVLGVLLILLLILLLVPSFATVVYDGNECSVVVGILFIRVHVYPSFYFLWDRYANETEAEREVRLAPKKAKQAAKKAADKEKKRVQKELDKKEGKKKPKITLDLIVALVQAAGLAMRLLLGALRIEKIRVRLPIHGKDPAQTGILYGKTNAWLYSSLAILNHFLYLDFEELQINPVFDENFERNAYFSCKVSAQLFIIVVIAFRLFQLLRSEEAILALLAKGKARKPQGN